MVRSRVSQWPVRLPEHHAPRLGTSKYGAEVTLDQCCDPISPGEAVES